MTLRQLPRLDPSGKAVSCERGILVRQLSGGLCGWQLCWRAEDPGRGWRAVNYLFSVPLFSHRVIQSTTWPSSSLAGKLTGPLLSLTRSRIKWIRTSWVSMLNSLSLAAVPEAGGHPVHPLPLSRRPLRLNCRLPPTLNPKPEI